MQMAQQPNDNSAGAGKRAAIDQAALLQAFGERCAALVETRRQRVQRRLLLAAEIEEKQRELAALDIEIAGIEGHGAEAEIWHRRISGAQDGGQEPPRPRLGIVPNQQQAGPDQDEDSNKQAPGPSDSAAGE
jgi:hypothetical protein